MEKEWKEMIGNMIGVWFLSNGAPVFLIGPDSNISFCLWIFMTIVLIFINFATSYLTPESFQVVNAVFSAVIIFCHFCLILFTPGIQVHKHNTVKLNHKYCVVCEVNKKQHTRHCPACDLCILDHNGHLPLFDKCIGKYNQHLFLVYKILWILYACFLILCLMRRFSKLSLPSFIRYGEIKYDFKYLKENLAFVKNNCNNRGSSASPEKVIQLWESFKKQQYDIDMMKKRKNQHSEVQPYATKDLEAHRKVMKDIKQQIEILETGLEKTEEMLMNEALKIPNLTHPEVPFGVEPVILSEKKPPEPKFSLKDHLDIGKDLNLFDFDSAFKTAGSKFVYLKNEAALIELALITWAMSRIRAKGYSPILTPDIAKTSIARACGFQPRDDADQLFTIYGGNLCLVATAEIPLAGLHSEETLNSEQLPLKYAGFSHCFRMEAGKGASSKGLYRMHQFSKVEMFAFCSPEDSERIHREMLEIQVGLVEELGFGYRVLDMPTMDLGASAYRKYDVEIWMPGKKDWGEVTSTSNCTVYQAIRLNEFYREKGNKKHLHTVNGTACAVPRILIGILEYGQREDGSVDIPKCLQPLLGFDRIEKKTGK